MKFTYTAIPAINPITSKESAIHRPYIPIDIAYENRWISKVGGFSYVDALIDSGADNNLAPLEFGNLLGVPWSTVKPKKTIGINGGIGIDTYFFPVAVAVGGDIYRTYMGFSEGLSQVLLGGDGFFNKYKVKFEYPRFFEVNKKN